MGYYCSYCGTYHEDGEACNCPEAQAALAAQAPAPGANGPVQGNYDQGTYSQGSYAQSNYGQSGFTQYNAGQNTYSQGNFNQYNAGQNTYSQGNFNQYNAGQNAPNQGGFDPNQGGYNPGYGQASYGQGGYNPGYRAAAPRQSFGETLKKFAVKAGFGESDSYGEGAYENGTSIVPDCLDLSEGEKPIRQYTVAKMNNRILGIPVEWAQGKLQLTNRRLVFRAPGSGIAGRTCLNYEFSVDEIGGVTVHRRQVFQPWALFVGLLLTGIGFAAFAAFAALVIRRGSYSTYVTLSVIFGLLLGAGGLAPFFLLNKRWFLKLLGLGVGVPALFTAFVALWYRSRAGRFFGLLFALCTLAAFLIWAFTLIRASLRPNLILEIQDKTAIKAIQVRRRTFSSLGAFGYGYTEILPAEDVENCVRELNAIINDIQQLGDGAVEKWQA